METILVRVVAFRLYLVQIRSLSAMIDQDEFSLPVQSWQLRGINTFDVLAKAKFRAIIAGVYSWFSGLLLGICLLTVGLCWRESTSSACWLGTPVVSVWTSSGVIVGVVCTWESLSPAVRFSSYKPHTLSSPFIKATLVVAGVAVPYLMACLGLGSSIAIACHWLFFQAGILWRLLWIMTASISINTKTTAARGTMSHRNWTAMNVSVTHAVPCISTRSFEVNRKLMIH